MSIPLGDLRFPVADDLRAADGRLIGPPVMLIESS